MTFETDTTIRCNLKGCDKEQHVGDYQTRPRDWIELDFSVEVPGLSLGCGPSREERVVKHFCSWEHLAEFVGVKLAKAAA